jgi:hypothetical protein
MRRRAWIVAGLLAVAVAAWAQQGNETTHFTVPSANTSFLSDLRTFLFDEDAARYADIHGTGMVASGGTHGTVGGLVGTPAALAAYPGGYYITETGAITYPDATTCWVIATRDITGNPSGNFVRVAGTHYAIDCVSGTQPALPALSVFLMQVTTAGGAITAVADLRPLAGTKDPFIPQGTLQLGVPSVRTGLVTFYNAGGPAGTSLQSGAAISAMTYTLPVAPPPADGALLSGQVNGVLQWVIPVGITIPPSPARYFYHGNCSVGTKVAQELIESGGTVVKVWAYADVAPTGADLILDIKKNGTSIWAVTPANRVKILSGANSGVQTVFDTTSASGGDRFSLDVVQVGATIAGCNDLLVSVQFGA